ncbi:hypothetical protein POJ06DRAFT_123022 [Lipomyces tetrasporus]|uniref:Glycosyl transferase family 25 domain-containing protein n=1 Tax=Lipomyces tetrasporus TaxID=54092 RepID=A0AAD7QRH3_9ASCO|nr:uncharacterized protein POJ06DRAFT_123022 [Lipomyces tetrasporus]KAJ8100055.1 hypothetical protein POJ06DRAFT_123022 [Lipomyces tetrasporus]
MSTLRTIVSRIGPLRATLVPGLLLTLIIFLVVHSSRSTDDDNADLSSAAHKAALAKRAHNSSLGFGEIVYISMPERTDRQDAMSLLADSFGLELKLVPGVRGTDISPKAIPDEVPEKMRPSELGCWRAHADAWRYLLESDMETLLIFEDDVDWNPNVKQTFETLSLQMQDSKVRLTHPSDHERKIAPYGLDWDVLYVGSCKDGGNPDFKGVSQIWDDPDVPSAQQTSKSTLEALYNFGLTDADIGKKRVLAPAYWTLCTTAYAITRQGAKRLLLTMSYLGLHAAVDNDMSRIFRDGKLKGYTLSPPAFSQFRVGGTKDSDRVDIGQTREGKGNTQGRSYNIKGSARQWMVDNLKLDNWEEYRRATGAKSPAAETW